MASGKLKNNYSSASFVQFPSKARVNILIVYISMIQLRCIAFLKYSLKITALLYLLVANCWCLTGSTPDFVFLSVLKLDTCFPGLLSPVAKLVAEISLRFAVFRNQAPLEISLSLRTSNRRDGLIFKCPKTENILTFERNRESYVNIGKCFCSIILI